MSLSVNWSKMVQLTSIRHVVTDTFGFRTRGKMYNHRKPIQFKHFKSNLDAEHILERLSTEGSKNILESERTFADAQRSLGRTSFLLPNLTQQELETNELFQKELERQRSLIARVERMEVLVDTKPYAGTKLIMNKGISTPYDCARHLHEFMTQRSVVAQLGPIDSDSDVQINEKLWDMHRPLEKSCRIKLRHFVENEDLVEVNKTYWRSCSFVLGMAIRMAFKDEVKVLLHSWPKPNIASGSFLYDVALGLKEKWTPSDAELRAFTKVMWQIKEEAVPFERLLVSADLAKKLFASNPFKLEAIDSMRDENGKVPVYRCGGMLDLSVGPMISNTNQIGRISLAVVHSFQADSESNQNVFYRFQGVSVPNQLPLSSYLYQNFIIEKAKQLNKSSLGLL